MRQPSLDTPSCRFIPAHCYRDFAPVVPSVQLSRREKPRRWIASGSPTIRQESGDVAQTANKCVIAARLTAVLELQFYWLSIPQSAEDAALSVPA
jgi:hypothetical protein